MIITVGGYPGSGKSTLCKLLISRYLTNYTYSYTGQIFRDMAAEKNMSIEEFYKQMASDPEGERAIDQRQAELMRSEEYLVVDGRMAAFQSTHFDMCKVLLTVDLEEGARRIQSRENKGKSLGQTLKEMKSRMEDERMRYRNLYRIEDFLDPKHYNLVLDTTKTNAEEIAWQLFRSL